MRGGVADPVLVHGGKWVLVSWVLGPGPVEKGAAVWLALLLGLVVSRLVAEGMPVGLWLLGG